MGAGDGDEAATRVALWMMVVVREEALGLLTMPKLIVSKLRRSIWAWLGIVEGGIDSVRLTSGNSFLPGDSRNHSSGI